MFYTKILVLGVKTYYYSAFHLVSCRALGSARYRRTTVLPRYWVLVLLYFLVFLQEKKFATLRLRIQNHTDFSYTGILPVPSGTSILPRRTKITSFYVPLATNTAFTRQIKFSAFWANSGFWISVVDLHCAYTHGIAAQYAAIRKSKNASFCLFLLYPRRI